MTLEALANGAGDRDDGSSGAGAGGGSGAAAVDVVGGGRVGAGAGAGAGDGDGAGARELNAEEQEKQYRGGELYRFAMAELPLFGPRSTLQQHQRMLDPDGVASQVQDLQFYECRAPECCILMPRDGEYVVCDTCKEARYCSQTCLNSDASQHAADSCSWAAPVDDDDGERATPEMEYRSR